MKKAILGALLSGLVFPGAGQIALKHTKRGIFFIVITIMSLLWLVFICVQKAFLILNQMSLEPGILDYNAIHEAAEKALAQSDSISFFISLMFLCFAWLFSTGDAYRIGRQMDKDIKTEKPFEL